MPGRIILERGDITRVNADAVVNASNAAMTPGGGVSGAIHDAGGPAIAAEAREVVARRGPLAPGEAAATTGGLLAARYVIHALGPVWHGGGRGEAEALASAYRESVRAADALGLATIAFPSISTGIFGYPVGLAAPVALRSVREALDAAAHVREVRFVLYDDATHRAYVSALETMEREESKMPVVRIDVLEGKPPAYRKAVLRGVREALREVVGVPDERISQRLVEVGADCLDVAGGRGERFTVVEISMLPGRTPEMKRALYAAVQRNLGADPGIEPHDIAILVRDVPAEDLCLPNAPEPGESP